MEALTRYGLYLTVFITGAAVLVVEIAAVRMLTPSFGSSLFVLSSVLSVVLAALSVGYYVGGILADRHAHTRLLFLIIAGSGLATLGAEAVALRILPSDFTTGYEPLVLSFALFFVPAFLLGIVSPFIIKLRSLSTPPERIGAVVGAVFFFGTVGSIAGSLATGYIFIPQFGVQATIISTGLVLVALGLAGHFGASRMRNRWSFGSALIIVFVAFGLYASLIPTTERGVVYVDDGLYSRIQIRDIETKRGMLRLLERDRNFSSGTLLGSDDLPFEYTQFAEFYPELKPDTEDFLLLGGGAYTIPRTLTKRDPNIRVDVAELEPGLYVLAKEYFALEDTGRVTNYEMDARVYLTQSEKTYDVIYGDAFGTDEEIPFHLATVEFFTLVREHLTKDGIFMMNYVGPLEGGEPSLTGSLYKSLEHVFPNIAVYSLSPNTPGEADNIMFVARNGDAPIELMGARIALLRGGSVAVDTLRISTDRFDLENEILLTDDHAPVEYLALKQE